VEVIFKFISMNLDFFQLLIIDYFIWALDFNFGFNPSDLTLRSSLFREGMFDFSYYSRLVLYFEFFCMNVDNNMYFIENFLNFKIYLTFLSIRDFLFSIIKSSVCLSICYYFLLKFFGLALKGNDCKLMVLNLPPIFFKKKREYVYLDYYLWWFLKRSLNKI
jgi:hypothetical protein